MELRDRAALITGGKRIGAAIAIDLAHRGMDIALSYNRSRAEAEDAASAVREAGRRVVLIAANLSQGSECQRLVSEAVQSLGRLDVLINMASVYRSVSIEETDEAAWDAVVDVDLKAAFLCSRAAMPHLRSAGAARIINFADWVAASGRPRYKNFVPYYVAKRGVIGLTEALALELASDQILVNAIAPGPIVAPPGTTAEEHNAVEASTPVGRWGGESEIVKAVAFLLDSDFVTGETLRVDGGRHVR
jgi:NAD(P)-dependent dehydrogenase (short-subunit alcohol dehydrogenase family)